LGTVLYWLGIVLYWVVLWPMFGPLQSLALIVLVTAVGGIWVRTRLSTGSESTDDRSDAPCRAASVARLNMKLIGAAAIVGLAAIVWLAASPGPINGWVALLFIVPADSLVVGVFVSYVVGVAMIVRGARACGVLSYPRWLRYWVWLSVPAAYALWIVILVFGGLAFGRTPVG
jgi:hypothetical protein